MMSQCILPEVYICLLQTIVHTTNDLFHPVHSKFQRMKFQSPKIRAAGLADRMSRTEFNHIRPQQSDEAACLHAIKDELNCKTGHQHANDPGNNLQAGHTQ